MKNLGKNSDRCEEQKLNRRRLASATLQYLEELDSKAALEERALQKTLAEASARLDFDREP
jgi:hypothetical protein